MEGCTPSRWRRRSPPVDLDTNALEAAKLLAEQRLPALVVTDPDGSPHSILPASQVVRFLVPSYVQDDPSLARVMNESMADRAGDKLGGKRVRDLLPQRAAGAAGGEPRRHDHRGRRDHGAVAMSAGGGDQGRPADRRDQRLPTAASWRSTALTRPRTRPAGGGRRCRRDRGRGVPGRLRSDRHRAVPKTVIALGGAASWSPSV